MQLSFTMLALLDVQQRYVAFLSFNSAEQYVWICMRKQGNDNDINDYLFFVYLFQGMEDLKMGYILIQ